MSPPRRHLDSPPLLGTGQPGLTATPSRLGGRRPVVRSAPRRPRELRARVGTRQREDTHVPPEYSATSTAAAVARLGLDRVARRRSRNHARLVRSDDRLSPVTGGTGKHGGATDLRVCNAGPSPHSHDRLLVEQPDELRVPVASLSAERRPERRIRSRPIASGTTSDYALTNAEVGSNGPRTRNRHECRRKAAAASNATAVIQGPSAGPMNTAAPTIAGLPAQGQVLVASTGTWSNSPTSFAFQWLRCPQSGGQSDGSDCAPIASATTNAYALTNTKIDRRSTGARNRHECQRKRSRRVQRDRRDPGTLGRAREHGRTHDRRTAGPGPAAGRVDGHLVRQPDQFHVPVGFAVRQAAARPACLTAPSSPARLRADHARRGGRRLPHPCSGQRDEHDR